MKYDIEPLPQDCNAEERFFSGGALCEGICAGMLQVPAAVMGSSAKQIAAPVAVDASIFIPSVLTRIALPLRTQP